MSKKSPQVAADAQVTEWMDERNSWRNSLKIYWPEMEMWREVYEFYKREDSETESDISLNTPFAIVEGYVERGNDVNMKVTAKARGHNDLSELEDFVGGIVKYAFDDSDVATFMGPFRKNKEMFEREFYIVGNAFAEEQYCYEVCEDYEGNQTVAADNPYVKVLNYKHVIFNPAKNGMTSKRYYVDKWVDWDELENNVKKVVKETLEDGTEVEYEVGKYDKAALARLKSVLRDNKKLGDDTEASNITNGAKTSRKRAPIHLIERWNGAKLDVIAEGRVNIRSVYDPMRNKRCPIVCAINYVLEGRPYGYGEIAAIYKLVRAQDAALSQRFEAIQRYLRPGFITDDPNAKVDHIVQVIENGGIAVAAGNVTSLNTTLPPREAFMNDQEMQQAIERTSRYSPYAAGQVGQSSDKTQGTKGGIIAIQTAAEPHFQTKLNDIQDMFLRPLARMYLQTIAGLMGDDEVRWALLTGKSERWISATKGLLQGKPTLEDLVICGVLTQQEAYALAYKPAIDEYGRPLHRQVQNPDGSITVQPVLEPSKYAQGPVFDIDWIIDVRLDPQSAADRFQATKNKMEWVTFSQGLGAQFHAERTAIDIGLEVGVKNPEELMLTEEEKIQMQQALMAQQAQQVEAEAGKDERQVAGKMKLEMVKGHNQLRMQEQKAQAVAAKV